MKKLLVIGHSSNSVGGAEDDFERMLIYLSNYFEIYSIFPNGPRSDLFKRYSRKVLIIPHKYFPFYKFSLSEYSVFILKSLKTLFLIFKFLNENRNLDVCIINSSVCFIEALPLIIFKIPHIVSIREVIRPKFVRFIIYKFFFSKAYCFHVISDYIKDIYLKYNNYTKTIHKIPSCLDLELYNRILCETQRDKSSDFLKIINVGAICELKNQLVLIEAINYLLKKHKQFKIHITLIGFFKKNDKYFKKIIRRIKKFHLESHFNILGTVSRETVIKEIIDSDLVVITSKEEGQSLFLLEALYLEKPIITTNVGIVPEIIEDRENGLIFAPNDSVNLASLIYEIITDVTFRSKLINNSKNTYFKNFDIQKSLNQLNSLLEDCYRKNSIHP